MYALKIASTVLAIRPLTFHNSFKKVCPWEHIGRDRSFTCFLCVYILQKKKKNENFLALGTNFTKHQAQNNLKHIREYIESKVKEN